MTNFQGESNAPESKAPESSTRLVSRRCDDLLESQHYDYESYSRQDRKCRSVHLNVQTRSMQDAASHRHKQKRIDIAGKSKQGTSSSGSWRPQIADGGKQVAMVDCRRSSFRIPMADDTSSRRTLSGASSPGFREKLDSPPFSYSSSLLTSGARSGDGLGARDVCPSTPASTEYDLLQNGCSQENAARKQRDSLPPRSTQTCERLLHRPLLSKFALDDGVESDTNLRETESKPPELRKEDTFDEIAKLDLGDAFRRLKQKILQIKNTQIGSSFTWTQQQQSLNKRRVGFRPGTPDSFDSDDTTRLPSFDERLISVDCLPVGRLGRPAPAQPRSILKRRPETRVQHRSIPQSEDVPRAGASSSVAVAGSVVKLPPVDSGAPRLVGVSLGGDESSDSETPRLDKRFHCSEEFAAVFQNLGKNDEMLDCE